MRKSVTPCSLASFTLEKKSPVPVNECRKGIPPGEWVIRNILNYSKALSVVKSENAGCIRMVMN